MYICISGHRNEVAHGHVTARDLLDPWAKSTSFVVVVVVVVVAVVVAVVVGHFVATNITRTSAILCKTTILLALIWHWKLCKSNKSLTIKYTILNQLFSPLSRCHVPSGRWRKHQLQNGGPQVVVSETYHQLLASETQTKIWGLSYVCIYTYIYIFIVVPREIVPEIDAQWYIFLLGDQILSKAVETRNSERMFIASFYDQCHPQNCSHHVVYSIYLKQDAIYCSGVGQNGLKWQCSKI